jgi:hypothetical protein
MSMGATASNITPCVVTVNLQRQVRI